MSYKKVLITSTNPSSYCESYKRVLIQSSNPIQFLDPAKFQTLTVSGVSFVSNNGVITANGTATGPVYFAVQSSKLNVFANHKMLLVGCPSGGDRSKYFIFDHGDDARGLDFGNGAIYPVTVDRSTYIYIYIAKGYVATNLQFKPRFYDLTATFGVGNEPTTLGAFRAKFPNEIYPYNPSYCSSPQSALITPTKNLFDISRATSTDPNLSIEDGTIKVSSYGVSVGTLHQVCPELKAGDQVMISWDRAFSTGTPANFVVMQNNTILLPTGKPVTITEEGLTQPVFFYNTLFQYKDVPTTSVYRNFQIEKGTTATSYVPYNYI